MKVTTHLQKTLPAVGGSLLGILGAGGGGAAGFQIRAGVQCLCSFIRTGHCVAFGGYAGLIVGFAAGLLLCIIIADKYCKKYQKYLQNKHEAQSY